MSTNLVAARPIHAAGAENMGIDPRHFSNFAELDGRQGKLSQPEYVMGVRACEAGDSDTSDATASWRAGFGAQFAIEQNAGSRRGVQKF